MNFFKIKHKDSLIVDDNYVYKYSDLKKKYEEYKKLKLKKGLVLFICFNNFEILSLYYFFFENKFPLLLLNKESKLEDIKNIIKLYKPKYFVTNNFELIDKEKLIKNYLYKFDRSDNYKINNKLSILISTSGSTGSSKFVKLSYENIIDNTKNILKYLKINKFDKTITTMPFSYSYGLSIINTYLKKNSTIILTERTIMEKEFWELVKKYKITNLNGVPKFWDILTKLGLEKLLICNLKTITQAGGSLIEKTNLNLCNFCIKHKIKFFKMYGQIEASPRISYLDPKFSIKKLNSIGKSIPNGKLSIEKGEIVYFGKNIFGGYSKNFKDLKRFQVYKKLYTGDLGFKDKENFYFITGRKKRIIKLNGNRYSLDEMEIKLNENLKNKCALIEQNNIIKVFCENNGDIDIVKNIMFKKFKIEKKNFISKNIGTLPTNKNNKINYSKLEKIK